jgi:hypothetical protein
MSDRKSRREQMARTTEQARIKAFRSILTQQPRYVTLEHPCPELENEG